MGIKDSERVGEELWLQRERGGWIEWGDSGARNPYQRS